MRLCSALIISMIFSLAASAQDLKEIPLDGQVFLKLPQPFIVKDTANSLVVTSKVETGLFVVSRIMNVGEAAAGIANDKELIDYYGGFRNGFARSTKGVVTHEEMVQIGKLKAYKFIYRIEDGPDSQLIDCIALFIKDRTYSVQFWRAEATDEKSKAIKDQVFSSLRITESLTEADQRTTDTPSSTTAGKTTSYQVGYSIGRILGMIAIPLAVVLVVIFVINRRKRK